MKLIDVWPSINATEYDRNIAAGFISSTNTIFNPSSQTMTFSLRNKYNLAQH
jgi:hypothetical protein